MGKPTNNYLTAGQLLVKCSPAGGRPLARSPLAGSSGSGTAGRFETFVSSRCVWFMVVRQQRPLYSK